MKKIYFLIFLFITTVNMLFAQNSFDINATGTRSLAAQESSDPAIREMFKDADRYRPFDYNTQLATLRFENVGDILLLNFFDDKQYEAVIQRVTVNDLGRIVITSKIVGSEFDYCYMVVSENAITIQAELLQNDEFFFASVKNGQAYIGQMKKSELQKNAIEGAEPLMDKSIHLNPSQGQGEGGMRGVNDPTTIDVLVVYTQAAETWALVNSGQTDINHLIDLALQKSNDAMTNSGTGVTFNVVYRYKTDYVEANSSIDLDRVTNTSDGYMDEVHDLRNVFYADEVLFIPSVTYTGGQAWQLMNSAGFSNGDHAFALSRVEQSSWTYTAVHEIGHNMGAHHHRLQNTQPGPGVFPAYSAGWRGTTTSNQKICTIMTYEEGKYFSDGVNHTRVGFFSSPDKSSGGVTVGSGTEDNARTIKETKTVVAAYRTAPVTATISVSPDELSYSNLPANSSKLVAVSGFNLSGNMTFSLGGTNPTAFTAVGAPWDAAKGGIIKVTFIGTPGQSYSATLTISGGGATNKVVNLVYAACSGETLVQESFDGMNYPPACWDESFTNSTFKWSRVEQMGSNHFNNGIANPPHSGSGMIQFYTNQTTTYTKSALLISPKINTNNNNSVLTFWMFRDFFTPNNERIKVYYSPTPSITASSTLIQTIPRYYFSAPNGNANQWNFYTYPLATAAMSAAYIIFEGESDIGFGVNMYLDDIKIEVLVPSLTINPSSLDFGEVNVSTTSASQNIAVSGTNLTGNITCTKGGVDPDLFSITSSSLTTSGGTIGVTFTPTVAGNYSATLTMSSAGAANKTVTLSGTGVVPPPTTNTTTNITHNSFIANWNAVSGANNYLLSVYTKQGRANIYFEDYDDKPVGNVFTHTVTGLTPNTTYYYTVKAKMGSDISLPSTEMMVKTGAAPITVCLDAGNGTINLGSFLKADTCLTEAASGAGITLPVAVPPIDCQPDYAFMGWATIANYSGLTAPSPLYPAGHYEPQDDEILYAVYAEIDNISSHTITITSASAGGSTNLGSNNYGGNVQRTWIQNGINFGGKAITTNSNNTPTGATAGIYLQAQASNGIIYNLTPLPGKITSITTNHGGTAVSTLCYGNTSGPLANATAGDFNVYGGIQVGLASTTGWTPTNFSGTKYNYFILKRGATAAYFSSIVIDYEVTTYNYATNPDCAPCEPYTVSFVNEGNPYESSITQEDCGDPITLPEEPKSACIADGWEFAGWSTEENNTDASNIVINPGASNYTPNSDITLYAVYKKTVKVPNSYTLISNTNDLAAGAKYLISSATSGAAKVMVSRGALTGTNNQGVTSETVTSSKIVLGSTSVATPFILGGNSGAWTFSDGTYFLTATSAASNNLRTTTTLDAWSYFTISFAPYAVIACTGKSTNHNMRYNNVNDIFSCYSSGQNNIYIFKESSDTTYTSLPDCAPPCEPYTVSFVNEGNPYESSITQEECGDPITLPEEPESACLGAGWVFAGWSTEENNTDGSNIVVLAGETEYTPDDDMTLYAVYKKIDGYYEPNATAQQFVIAGIKGIDYYALPATPFADSNPLMYLITINSIENMTYATPTNALGYEWTIQGDNTTGFTISTGANYLKPTPPYNLTQVVCDAGTGYWRIENGTTGTYRVLSALSSYARGLGLNVSQDWIGHYVIANLNAGTQQKDMELLPITDVITIAYSSLPDCTEPFSLCLDAGNGTIDLGSFAKADTCLTGDGGIILPTATPDSLCQLHGYTFAGWTDTDEDEWDDIAPSTLYPDGYTYGLDAGENANTLFAVYMKDAPPEYDLVNSAPLADGEYLIGTLHPNNNYYFFNGAFLKGHGQGTSSQKNITQFVGLPVVNALKMTITAAATADHYYITHGTDTLGAAAAYSGNLTLGTQYTDPWKITYPAGVAVINYSHQYANGYPQLRGYDGTFRTYAPASLTGNQPIALFKETKITIYTTNPDCPPLEKYEVCFDALNGIMEAGTYIGTDTCLTEEVPNGGIVLPIAKPWESCQDAGYTFVGWSTAPIGQTNTRPALLLEPGFLYFPTSNTTLYAVYMKGNVWEEVTTLAQVDSGDYIITFVHDSQPTTYYYLPNTPTVTVSLLTSPGALSGITVSGNRLTNPIDNKMVWNFNGNNSTGFKISQQVGVNKHALGSVNAAQGIYISSSIDTTTWKVFTSTHSGHLNGLVLRGSDRATPARDLALFINNGGTPSWRYYANTTTCTTGAYCGDLHLFKYMLDTVIYDSYPSCLEYYTITASVDGGHGIIEPPGETTVSEGSTVVYTITPDACYEINKVWIDGAEETIAGNNYTFANVDKNHTIVVSFKKKVYTSTFAHTACGSYSWEQHTDITESGSYEHLYKTKAGCDSVVTMNLTITKKVTPEFDFDLLLTYCEGETDVETLPLTDKNGITGTWNPEEISTTGSAVGTTTTYTFTPAEGECAEPIDIEVTVNSPTYGTDVIVMPCGATTFTWIDDVEYTSNNYTATHTIEEGAANGCDSIVTLNLTFTEKLTPNLSGIEIQYCEGATIPALPTTIKDITGTVDITGDWAPALDNTTTTTYTFTPTTGQCVAAGPFEVTINISTPYTISATANTGGVISPNGPAVVIENCGNSKTFEFAPNSCYRIAQVLINGTNNPTAVAAGTYTFTGVVNSANTIEVQFEKISYTITATAVGNGTIAPHGTIAVNCGDDKDFVINASPGYTIYQVIVDGVPVPAAAGNTTYPLEFINITGNHTIIVSFTGGTCPENVIDKEGNDYIVTWLSGLCWTENLRNRTYADGSAIPFARAYYCKSCPDTTKLIDTYGLLYTWYSAVNQAAPGRSPFVQGICPDGWHIPSRAELDLLDNYTAQQLKSSEPQHWSAPGTDSYNFSLLPAGTYNGSTDRFIDLHGATGLWSSEAPASSNQAYCYYFSYYCNFVQSRISPKVDGLSVRCIMNY